MPDFDPYHRWLGIPPDEQPAGPQRLLGVSPDENDPQVVQEAALRQTAFVRQFSLGEHGEHAERILGELAEVLSSRSSLALGVVDPIVGTWALRTGMESVGRLKRRADLEIVSFRHGMSPVQGAAKSLAVKWLYFLLLKS